jgi:hypothetical protein
VTLAVPATLSGLSPLAAPAGAAEDSALPSGAAPPSGFLEELLNWSPAAGGEHESRHSFWPDEPAEGPEPGPVSGVPPAAAPRPPGEDGQGRILESAGLSLPAFVPPAVAALATLSAYISPADPALPLEPVLPVSALSPFPGLGASSAPSPASYRTEVAMVPPEALGGSLPDVLPSLGREAPHAATPSSRAPVSALGHAWLAAQLIDAAPTAGAPPRETTPRGELALAIEATQKPPAHALEGSRAPLPSKPPEAPAQAGGAGARPVAEAPPESRTAEPALPGPAGAEAPAGSRRQAVEASGDEPYRPHAATITMRVRPEAPPEAPAAKGTLAGTPFAGAGEAEGKGSPESAGRRPRPAREPEAAGTAYSRVPPARCGDAPKAKEIEPLRPARAAATADKPAAGLPVPGPGHVRTAPGPAVPSGATQAGAGSPAGPAQLLAGEAPLRTAPSAPARRIELRLARPHAEALTVEVADRRGRIELAVRTPDRELAASLGEQAAEVVRRLEAAGFRAHAFTPQAPDRALEPRLEMTAETRPDFRERGLDARHEGGGRNPEEGAGQDPDGEFPAEEFFSLRAGREEIDR